MHKAQQGYNPNHNSSEAAWSVINEEDGTIYEYDLHGPEARIIAELLNQLNPKPFVDTYPGREEQRELDEIEANCIGDLNG